MAAAFDAQGLLDIKSIKTSDYAALPKTLAEQPKREAGPGDSVLFTGPPEWDDVTPLTKAKPYDWNLHSPLTATLNGLASGPGMIMGMFRGVGPEEVVVRLYKPQPLPDGAELDPIYFRVRRSHAQLARDKQWVGPQAPTWVALLAAVYYSHIGNPKAFYGRKDLGGAANAAFLVLYGKNSSLAEYLDPPASKSKSAGGTTGKTATGSLDEDGRDLLDKVLGIEQEASDEKYFAKTIFASDPTTASKRAKELATLVSKLKYDVKSGLPIGLTEKSICQLAPFHKWLGERGELPKDKPARQDLIAKLELFLEINGVLSSEGKQRYEKAEITVWEGVRSDLKRRLPLVFLLRPPASPATLEVVGTAVIELAGAKKTRDLRYLVVRVAKEAGRSLRCEEKKGLHILSQDDKKRDVTWLELRLVLLQTHRICIGQAALDALGDNTPLVSAELEVPARLDDTLAWPRTAK